MDQLFLSWLSRGCVGPSDERGASLVEYALLIALIAMVCIGAVSFFGGSVSGRLGGVNF